MYREVRFHRMTSNRKKESDNIFRLKKDGRNLDTIDYANNLKCYLDKTKKMKSITISELNLVLSGLGGESGVQAQPALHSENEDFFVGEHVASFWLDDDGVYRWYLGVVHSVLDETCNRLLVSYFHRSNRYGTSWNYPQEEEIRATDPEQIIARRMSVSYHCFAIIRCSIDEKVAEDIEQNLQSIVLRLKL